MQYYVYTLAYPDGVVFYVGKGKGKRVADHEKEALRGHNCPKCELIRSIWQQGGTVQRAIVFETDHERAALDREAELIREYGYDRLMNRNGAGTGHCPHRTRRARRAYDDTLCPALVDQLFKTHLRPDGKEYTYLEVAAASGGLLDATLIGKLRSGKTSNPGRTTILGLCRFFQVPASYFFPDVKPVLPAGTILRPDIDTSLLALGVPAHLHVHIRAVIDAFVDAERR